MTTQAAPVQETPEAPVGAPSIEAPQEAPVLETPAAPVAETSAAAPPPSPATRPLAIDPTVQEYITRLETQQREAQAQAAARAATDALARRHQELLGYGLEPVQAQAIAEREQQLLQQAQNAIAKANYAAQLADEHKVPVASLMQYDTPAAMKVAAERVAAETTTASQIKALQEELAALKRGQVPAQQFDNGRGRGAPTATPENVDALWVAFDREHPEQKNPYDDGYRSFLRSLRQ